MPTESAPPEQDQDSDLGVRFDDTGVQMSGKEIRHNGPNGQPVQGMYVGAAYIIPQEEHASYASDSNVLVMDTLSLDAKAIRSEKVGVELVRDIVRRDSFYEHFQAIIDTRVARSFDICYRLHDIEVAGMGVGVTIANAVHALGAMSEQGEFTNDQKAQQRIAELRKLVSPEQLHTDFAGATYRNVVDDQPLEVPIPKLLGILLSSDEEYEQFVEHGDSSGVPKERLAFALCQFVQGNSIFARYDLPGVVRDRFVALASYKHVDFETVGARTKIDQDEAVGEAIMDEGLHDRVLEGMPADLSDPERAIWAYLKLCQVLTYDRETFAYDATGPITQKFMDVSRVATITPENNNAVCVEINVLFQKMLQEMGIGFETKYGSLSEQTGFFLNAGYGEGHAHCRARAGKFIVDFDSVRKVVGGDLAGVKLGQRPNGIICRNKNQRTQDEFATVLNRVSDRFYASQEQARTTQAKQIEGLLAQNGGNLPPFGTRVEAFFSILQNSQLAPVDAFTHALMLHRALFRNDQADSGSVAISLLRENQAGDAPTAQAAAVISVMTKAADRQDNVIRYFVYKPPAAIASVESEEIRRRLNDRTYEYLVGQESHHIPGVALSRSDSPA